SSGKVLILTFLSSQQGRSLEAVKDVYGVLSSVPEEKLTSLQVAFVMQNVDNKDFIAAIQEEAPCAVRILADDQYHIWGEFGIIATPTIVISGLQGTVLCVKPGLAYDVVPVVKSRLFQALGLPCNISPDDASTVRTVANSTVSAKAKRHLKTARLLMEKDRVSSAIEQAQMAYEIDPNSDEVAVELAGFLYRAGRTGRVGQAQKVLMLVSEVSGQKQRDKARINLLLGWANRELGRLEEAERLLQKGITQDPTSPRLFYELGRIYQTHNDSERAMQAYFRALQLIYEEE
ncbi:MAG: tetratricopeptide repeat protein, partial [Phycisphaeraceae bacterium]|nr:tetratricopeptide repeat protein [Phycisphaeraceae bacterium]